MTSAEFRNCILARKCWNGNRKRKFSFVFFVSFRASQVLLFHSFILKNSSNNISIIFRFILFARLDRNRNRKFLKKNSSNNISVIFEFVVLLWIRRNRKRKFQKKLSNNISVILNLLYFRVETGSGNAKIFPFIFFRARELARKRRRVSSLAT